jgi:hypothetical protein
MDLRLNELKKNAKKRGLRVSGNKEELKKRIYIYDYLSKNAIKIQRVFKRWIIKMFNNYQGFGKICLNVEDYLTFNKVKDISYGNLFTFKEDKFIYGFEINSFNELISSKNVSNPYNRNPIRYEVIKSFMEFVRLKNILKINTRITVKLTNIDVINLIINDLNNSLKIPSYYLYKINNKKKIKEFIDNLNNELKDRFPKYIINDEKILKIKKNKKIQKRFLEILQELVYYFKINNYEILISYYIYISLIKIMRYLI